MIVWLPTYRPSFASGAWTKRTAFSLRALGIFTVTCPAPSHPHPVNTFSPGSSYSFSRDMGSGLSSSAVALLSTPVSLYPS